MEHIVKTIAEKFNIDIETSWKVVAEINRRHKIESLLNHLDEFHSITEILIYYTGGNENGI